MRPVGQAAAPAATTRPPSPAGRPGRRRPRRGRRRRPTPAARATSTGTGVGEHVLHRLEGADRPAELGALPGVGSAEVDGPRPGPPGGRPSARALRRQAGGLLGAGDRSPAAASRHPGDRGQRVERLAQPAPSRRRASASSSLRRRRTTSRASRPARCSTSAASPPSTEPDHRRRRPPRRRAEAARKPTSGPGTRPAPAPRRRARPRPAPAPRRRRPRAGAG